MASCMPAHRHAHMLAWLPALMKLRPITLASRPPGVLRSGVYLYVLAKARAIKDPALTFHL